MMLRYEGGARGMLWASQVAVGNENNLRLRIYGEKAGIEWRQEEPNALCFGPYGKPPQLVTRGGPAATEAEILRGCRVTKPLAQVLLAPQSVAIIGQSNDVTKTAGRPLKYLRQAGYAGRIYPINPRRDEVLGERAWPSLAELPELPDHAYIVASTEAEY